MKVTRRMAEKAKPRADCPGLCGSHIAMCEPVASFSVPAAAAAVAAAAATAAAAAVAAAAAGPGRSSRGLASLTVRVRPCSCWPFMPAMASSPPVCISTKANPRLRPVSRSLTTCAPRTVPYWENA
jgi:hypothetical protein